MLAGEWRLLTARHVLRRAEASGGALTPAIEVQFPFAAADGAGARVAARRVLPDVAAAAVDVGMLDLIPDGDPPGCCRLRCRCGLPAAAGAGECVRVPAGGKGTARGVAGLEMITVAVFRSVTALQLSVALGSQA